MARVRSPGGLAAYIGRRKYGKKRFARMSAAGRRRASRGGRRTNRPGGGRRFQRLKTKFSRRR